MAQHIQIDVLRSDGTTVTCNMYTGDRCVKICMAVQNYNDLIRDGFFLRDGIGKDSAGVLNTTNVYIPQL
jgi:hypothetical protein